MNQSGQNSGPTEPDTSYLIPPHLTQEERIAELRGLILSYYREHGRDYPWRKNSTPYSVIVSEFMLQQTQTDRVAPKFAAFLHAFPDFPHLAAAPLSDILTAWQGLGYNRRARFLHRTAEIIVSRYNGIVPDDTGELESLPGIGHATACAIRAYAFNAPVIYIETNIRTVFIHHFFRERTDVSDAEILPLVTEALYRENPRLWYSALMDYGVMLKKNTSNPGRNSRHYTRQSPFKGSRRELRGLIIRHLTQNKQCDLNTFVTASGRTQDEVVSVLEDLVSENMVAEERGGYCIQS